MSVTLFSPKFFLATRITCSVSLYGFTVGGYLSLNSNSTLQPKAEAVLRVIWTILAFTASITFGLYVRSVPIRVASSGITLKADPAWNEDMERTKFSFEEIILAIMVFRVVTTDEPQLITSFDKCGSEA